MEALDEVESFLRATTVSCALLVDGAGLLLSNGASNFMGLMSFPKHEILDGLGRHLLLSSLAA